ncbi:MAG: hypothetical protein ACREM3_09500, partial [Candidatus Rokuibacteriota bacterium]
MRNVLYAVTLLLLVGAAYVAYALYEKFVGDHSVRIVESIQHELAATDEFVFSRDRMSFSETQNNKAGLAHVNYLYTWQASVPFGFRAGDLDLSFEKASKTLSVRVKKLQLLDFTISAQKSQKTSEFAWLNQGEPAQKFWEGVNAHTRRLINAEFAKDRRLVGDVVQITRSSLTAAVLQILNKLNLSGL